MTSHFKLATSKMWQFKNWLKGKTFKAFIARPIICLTSASLLLLEQAQIVHQKVKLVRVPEGGDRVHPMPRRHNFLKSELFSHCLPTMGSLAYPPALRKNIDQFSELPGRRTRVPGCRVDCEETAEKEDVPSKDLSSRAHTATATQQPATTRELRELWISRFSVSQRLHTERQPPSLTTPGIVVIQSQQPFSFKPDSISSQSLLNIWSALAVCYFRCQRLRFQVRSKILRYLGITICPMAIKSTFLCATVTSADSLTSEFQELGILNNMRSQFTFYIHRSHMHGMHYIPIRNWECDTVCTRNSYFTFTPL